MVYYLFSDPEIQIERAFSSCAYRSIFRGQIKRFEWLIIWTSAWVVHVAFDYYSLSVSGIICLVLRFYFNQNLSFPFDLLWKSINRFVSLQRFPEHRIVFIKHFFSSNAFVCVHEMFLREKSLLNIKNEIFSHQLCSLRLFLYRPLNGIFYLLFFLFSYK